MKVVDAVEVPEAPSGPPTPAPPKPARDTPNPVDICVRVLFDDALSARVASLTVADAMVELGLDPRVPVVPVLSLDAFAPHSAVEPAVAAPAPSDAVTSPAASSTDAAPPALPPTDGDSTGIPTPRTLLGAIAPHSVCGCAWTRRDGRAAFPAAPLCGPQGVCVAAEPAAGPVIPKPSQ